MKILGWIFLILLLAVGAVMGIDHLTRTGETKLVGASYEYDQGRAVFGSRSVRFPAQV